MANSTPTQGRYLAFVDAYTRLHGFPPAEAEIAAALGVSPPSAHGMVVMLERKGLIERQPGEPRSLRVLVPREEIPPWNADHPSPPSKLPRVLVRSVDSVHERPKKRRSKAMSANLCVLSVRWIGGPMGSVESGNREVSRVIEVRGDQSLTDLHWAIFDAFDREEEHLFEFNFGKRPNDRKGFCFGWNDLSYGGDFDADSTTTTFDDLKLRPRRVFYYTFDFGPSWEHRIQIQRVGRTMENVAYPRVVQRVGKSPPQYPVDDEDEVEE